MASLIGVKEARARFSDLLDRVEKGEEIALTRRGREIARIVPSGPKPSRKGGWYKGEFWAAPDWEETPQEIIDLMEGQDDEWWLSSLTQTSSIGGRPEPADSEAEPKRHSAERTEST